MKPDSVGRAAKSGCRAVIGGAHRGTLDENPDRRFLLFVWFLVAAVGLTVGLRQHREATPPTRVDYAQSEEDAVVQKWWRETADGAHVVSCKDTGEKDFLTDAPVWACSLWYLNPDERVRVCVAMGEHKVERRIRHVRVAGRLCA